MVVAQRNWATDLLHCWFQELNRSDWFGSSERVDDLLRSRFEEDLLALGEWPASEFLDDREIAQAAILLFDQVPRNLSRGTAKAFTYDPLARETCKGFIDKGWDEDLPDRERQFIAMPLMHSENIADQEASLAYFTRHLPENTSFAESHHEMIVRFGRFPHRNEALNRVTTEEEQRAIEDGFSW